MKKHLILCAIGLAAFGLNAQAQAWSVGAHAGASISSFVGGNAYTIYDQGSKAGYEVGADVRYTLKNGLNASAGLSLTQTGGEFSTMSNFYNRDTQFAPVSARMLSVELPVKIGYDFKVSRAFSVNPFVGVYGRYAFASLKDDVTIAPLKETCKWNCFEDFSRYSYQIDAFRRFEAGVSAGVEATIAKHYAVSFSYKRGLTDLSGQYGIKSQAFTLSVGYRW